MLTKEQDRLRKQRAREIERESALINETGRRTGETKRQYAEFLVKYNWDYFLTTTFRNPRKEPYYALESVWNTLKRCNAGRGFLCAEPHQSGDLHIHGIVSGYGPGFYPELLLPWDIWDMMFKQYGRSKIEACHSQENVTAYCSKYLLKQQDRVCDYYAVYGDSINWKRGLINY